MVRDAMPEPCSSPSAASFAVSQRSRSDFRGEVQGFGGDRTVRIFEGEKVTDVQLGYTIQSGPLENLSFLLQGSGVTEQPVHQFGTVGIRPTFADIGESIAHWLGLAPGRHGKSFL